MKKILLIFSLALFSLGVYGQDKKNDQAIYTYKKGDYFGIGKWYLGREIAYVMGYEGISWLERPNREDEEKTSILIKNMNIKKTDYIADIGAGSGYHVFKMAPRAKKGEVYAVDIQPEMLRAILMNSQFDKNQNIELVQGAEKTVNLPKKKFDKILMVDVYHEFNYPKEMMESIIASLKDDGEIYLIEYRMEDSSVPIKKVHKMSEKQAVKEMKFVGLKLKENIDNLPWQHCMVFVKDTN
ncbi:MAG: SAM-dependent methyltransferase [Flavobacteriaceae bacterium]|nr:SAM-dependent methyltransferase [Flavobacteriaceae bacterium]